MKTNKSNPVGKTTEGLEKLVKELFRDIACYNYLDMDKSTEKFIFERFKKGLATYTSEVRKQERERYKEYLKSKLLTGGSNDDPSLFNLLVGWVNSYEKNGN